MFGVADQSTNIRLIASDAQRRLALWQCPQSRGPADCWVAESVQYVNERRLHCLVAQTDERRYVSTLRRYCLIW